MVARCCCCFALSPTITRSTDFDSVSIHTYTTRRRRQKSGIFWRKNTLFTARDKSPYVSALSLNAREFYSCRAAVSASSLERHHQRRGRADRGHKWSPLSLLMRDLPPAQISVVITWDRKFPNFLNLSETEFGSSPRNKKVPGEYHIRDGIVTRDRTTSFPTLRLIWLNSDVIKRAHTSADLSLPPPSSKQS